MKYVLKQYDFEYHFKNGHITAVSEDEILENLAEYDGKFIQEFDNKELAINDCNNQCPTTKLTSYATNFLVGTAYVAYENEYDEDNDDELINSEVIEYSIEAYDPNEEN